MGVADCSLCKSKIYPYVLYVIDTCQFILWVWLIVHYARSLLLCKLKQNLNYCLLYGIEECLLLRGFQCITSMEKQWHVRPDLGQA